MHDIMLTNKYTFKLSGGGIMFKKVEKDCAYCKFGHMMLNEEHIACKIYGLTQRRFKCSHFVYNPLKRIPFTVPAIQKFEAKDFSIE